MHCGVINDSWLIPPNRVEIPFQSIQIYNLGRRRNNLSVFVPRKKLTRASRMTSELLRAISTNIASSENVWISRRKPPSRPQRMYRSGLNMGGAQTFGFTATKTGREARRGISPRIGVPSLSIAGDGGDLRRVRPSPRSSSPV